MRHYIHIFAKGMFYFLFFIDVLVLILIIVLYFMHVNDGMWGPAWSEVLFLLGIPALFFNLLAWLMARVTK